VAYANGRVIWLTDNAETHHPVKIGFLGIYF